jgi:twinkle protein
MSDILTLKRALNDRVGSVVEKLLPNGRRHGREWKAGSIDGEKGESLGVVLDGDKVGVWQDFATGETGGDLIDLWRAARRLDLPEALDDIRAWLGVERPQFHKPAEKQFKRPPKPKCVKPEARVRDYLTEERNIPEEIITRYQIGESGSQIIFPFKLPNGELALAKAREAVDGGDTKPTAKDCEPVLFGWQAMPANAREVVITEGEIDALSWAAYGYPALSVPFGGGGGNKQRWIESEYDRLERFERIYLALDMDQPGEEAVAEIVKRLGRARCFRVTMPKKDGNACLVDGVPKAEMDRCIAEAKSMDPEGLRLPSEYTGNVVGLFYPTEGHSAGYGVPYDKLRGKLHFRPGEVTLWTGDSGDGKSQILSDCTPHWVHEGSRLCLCSLEMKPAQTLKRMVKQIVGTDRPTQEIIAASLQWVSGGLLLYDLVGKATVEHLLEVFDYARAKYGCDQFVIDSLMRLGVASDDYNSQEGVIYRLVDWAIERDVHLHLVAHAKKGERDRGVPTTQDVKGAMEIGANAFNILAVWRNRRLEDQITAARSAQPLNQDVVDELERKPGVVLNVAKQRNGDFEGKVGLWFDQETYRYRCSPNAPAGGRRYLPADWRGAA